MLVKRTDTIFSFLFIVISGYGQKLVHYSNVEELIALDKGVQYYRDANGEMKLAEIISPKTLWETNIAEVLNFENTDDNIWIKFTVKNETFEPLFLQFGNPELDDITCYGVQRDSLLWKRQSGNNQPFVSRYLQTNKVCMPLGDEDVTVYVKIHSGSGMYLPLSVGSIKSLSNVNHKDDLFNGAVFGIMVVIMLYNFFLFLSIRDPLYIQYCIYLFWSTLMMFFLEGLHIDLFGRGDYTLNNSHLPNTIVACATIAAIWFSSSFLNVKTNAPKMKWVNGILVSALLLSVAVDFMGNRVLSNNLVQASSGVTSIYLFVLGVVLFFKGLKEAKFYILSWGVLVTSAVIYILTLNGVLNISFITLNSFQIGSMLEGVLLSFALADRINSYRKEKNVAQKLAIAEVQKNEQLIRSQNVRLENEVEKRTHELKAEMKKSEDLLLNILPQEVAEELKEKGASEAKLFNRVSVIFTDFVNFTGIGAKLSPTELVNELHRCFKAFDEIVDKFGVEKIKTIGDSYLAVSGMPVEKKNHAVNATLAALEMNAFISEHAKLGGLFHIRLGINSGPVVAGIVGVKKFAYDIWGDTVNTASRMESNSESGKINISQSTYELIKDDHRFVFQHRGQITVKGK